MTAEPLPEGTRDLPRVVIAERVIDKIVRGALLYPEPETGEAMVGLVVPQAGKAEPDIYVLDTISPGQQAVREWGRFEQGDDWQGDVFHWLHVNWEAFREMRRTSYGSALAAKWDTPLRHVGDWHKQPGSMIAPSGGDAETARSMIADSETHVEHIVAPIVTMYPLQPEAETSDENGGVDGPAAVEEAPPATPQSIVRRCPDEGWLVRIDFWYMSKRAPRFVAVTPTLWPDDRLPGLPPLAWHLARPRRFEQEFGLLREAGYVADVVRWDADGKPPYEVCFSVYREGASQAIILVTGADYPAVMPAVRVAPLVTVGEGEDVFERLYAASRPLLLTELPDWTWDSKRTLVELVWHIEKAVL